MVVLKEAKQTGDPCHALVCGSGLQGNAIPSAEGIVLNTKESIT